LDGDVIEIQAVGVLDLPEALRVDIGYDPTGLQVRVG